MARLGFRTINEMVGRVDKLRLNSDHVNDKTQGLDLTPILTLATSLRPGVPTFNVETQNHALAERKDNLVCRDSFLLLLLTKLCPSVPYFNVCRKW